MTAFPGVRVLSATLAAPLVISLLAPAAQAQSGLPPAPVDREAALMPSPSGDPFFDVPAADPAGVPPGTELARRDVTAVAAPIAGAPISRATQFQFRTTTADGEPTFGTATLLEPVGEPGPGPSLVGEPVFIYNSPIDSLGRRCTSGYSYAHGDLAPGVSYARRAEDIAMPFIADALRAGTSVLVPDHQGPSMAYADPFTAGHTILDAARTGPMGDASRYVMAGYSGGAIASLGAAKLADTYAPEVADRMAGVSIGGVPADFEVLTRSMNANLASGLLGAAIIGLGRAHPELLDLLTDQGARAAAGVKDLCLEHFGVAGATLADLRNLAGPGALTSPAAEAIYERTRMSDRASAAPLQIYQGQHEFWIPLPPVRELARQQRELGVDVTMQEVPGEHLIAAFTGYPGARGWIAEKLRGPD